MTDISRLNSGKGKSSPGVNRNSKASSVRLWKLTCASEVGYLRKPARRLTIGRIIAMTRTGCRVLSLGTLAILVFLAGVANTLGQETQKVQEGQRVTKFKGIVSKRDADSFTMGETMGGAQTVVVLTPATEVKKQ